MGDTPKKEMSEAWRNARVSGGVLREQANNYRRIEAVRQWEERVPAVLEDDVSVRGASLQVINAGIHDGLSLTMVMRMIKLAREFQAASPAAWLDHQHMGQVIALRENKAALAEYSPGPSDISETGRLMEVNKFLEKAVRIVHSRPKEVSFDGDGY